VVDEEAADATEESEHGNGDVADEAAQPSDESQDNAEDAEPADEAAEGKKAGGDDLGESRYTRKGRRLPRIDEGDSKSSGSGLRNAIISGNKHRSSS
jgi:hypothetical protein